MRTKETLQTLAQNARQIGVYGAENQLIEEMGELMQAIGKKNRFTGMGQPLRQETDAQTIRKELVEEIADVRTVLDEMIILYDCADEADVVEEEKIERTKKLLEET